MCRAESSSLTALSSTSVCHSARKRSATALDSTALSATHGSRHVNRRLVVAARLPCTRLRACAVGTCGCTSRRPNQPRNGPWSRSGCCIGRCHSWSCASPPRTCQWQVSLPVDCASALHSISSLWSLNSLKNLSISLQVWDADECHPTKRPRKRLRLLQGEAFFVCSEWAFLRRYEGGVLDRANRVFGE